MNTAHKTRILGVLSGGTLVMSVITAVCLMLSFFNTYDADIGYFTKGSPYWISSIIISLFTCIAVIIVSFVLFRKGTLSIPRHTSLTARYFSLFVCLVLIAFGICGFVISGDCTDEGLRMLIVIRSLLALPAAVYFATLIFRKRGIIRNTASVAVLFCLILALGTSYFDRFTPINGPVKLLIQLAIVAFLVSFLFEVRALIGGEYIRPRGSFAFSLISMFACIGASIPIITAQLANLIDKTDYFLCAVLLLTLGVYRAVRTVHLICRQTDD